MSTTTKIETVSYVLVAMGLLAVLASDLLPAFLAGLLIYHLVEFGAVALGRIGVLPDIGRIVLLIIIAAVVVSGVSFGLVGLVSRMTAGPDSLIALFHKMADVVDTTRNHLPLWTREYLPANVEEWQAAISGWLRENARHLNVMGLDVGIFLFHLIVGMIIGGLIALNGGRKQKLKPLASALNERMVCVAGAFRRIVFSQIRISLLNTCLTAIFLVGVLPAFGYPLPLAKTLIAVTFIVGLLPIVGNLISNTVITLVALSVSPVAAFSALIFLILIHKLEYFVNARIIGSQIRARAWEILVAMMVVEAIFGLPGLVAAPIYYAYIKDELSAKGLV